MTRPQLARRIETVLDAFPCRTIPLRCRRHAAVTITVVTNDGDGTPAVLLTRRAARLRAHSGQFALPGGRVDPGETVQQAARRELEEELAVTVPDSEVLGRLDDYATRSGYVITPVVLWAGEPGTEPVPQEAEVARVFRIPFDDLDVDPQYVTIPESDRPVVRMPLLGHLVHAPTAAVLLQFREVVLRGRHTRVAHLEQPVFAWR